MLITISIIFCTVFVIWYWILKELTSKKSHDTSPPTFPGALPLIGHAFKLIGNNTHAWKVIKDSMEICNKNGGVMSGYTGPYVLHVITDPDASLKISNKCLDKPYLYGFLDDILQGGLVTADLKTWKLHRKLINPSYRSTALYPLLKIFNDHSRRFVSTISNKVGSPFFIDSSLVSSITKLSVDTTLGLSYHEDDLVSEKFAHSFETIAGVLIQRIYKIWLQLPFIYNLSNLKKQQDEHKEILRKTTEMRINESKITMMKQTDYNPSEEIRPLIEELLILKEKRLLNDEDLIGHLNTIIAAAFDTTASAICFTILLLGKHQDVQERVYQEIKEVLQDRDDVTREDLSKLMYLNAVIKESLRLYPSGPMVLRKIDRDIEIKDFILKDGSYAALGIYGINRSPVWGANADNFRPERWIEPDGVPPNANAFATFSIGKRNCIGQQFAMLVMKTMLVHFLRRYRVHGDVDNLVLKLELVLKPVSGHEITLELRK